MYLLTTCANYVKRGIRVAIFIKGVFARAFTSDRSRSRSLCMVGGASGTFHVLETLERLARSCEPVEEAGGHL